MSDERHDKVEVYLDDAGEWRWRRIAPNGEIVAVGEGYVAKSDAIDSAEDYGGGFPIEVQGDE